MLLCPVYPPPLPTRFLLNNTQHPTPPFPAVQWQTRIYQAIYSEPIPALSMIPVNRMPSLLPLEQA